MFKLVDTIGKMVEEILPDESLYLVDVEIKGSKAQPKVIVKIDGDDGVTIDSCASISRQLGNEIEERELIETAYNLEVTSPGLDQPITLRRQYERNIGRKLNIELKEGEVVVGKLLAIEGEELKISAEVLAKNGKNKKFKERNVAFEEIKIANVIISFK